MGSKYKTIDIEWSGICCKVKGKSGDVVDILKGVSGRVQNGRVTSIMGPSGAGKTTLVRVGLLRLHLEEMDVLAGRTQQNSQYHVEGVRTVNGLPPDPLTFRQSTAYVTQEDYLPVTETLRPPPLDRPSPLCCVPWLLLSECEPYIYLIIRPLTTQVRECLMFSAQLRLPGNLTTAEKSQKVDDVIEELGLTSVSGTYIGSRISGIPGVSGGEKKRASIGVELITSPTCLFLDEPTSGLDSEIAIHIITILKNIAAQGRTIAFTIHQPNSNITELFDHFILMARGRILYGGPWEGSVETFAESGFQCPDFKNPTDYYMTIASNPDNHAALLVEQEKGTLAITQAAAAAPDTEVKRSEVTREGPQANMFVQMWYLIMRVLRQWKRHPIMLVGEAVQYIFIGAFVGGMYFNVSDDADPGVFDRAASSWFLIVAVGLTPAFTAITVWQDERKLVRREVTQNVYSLSVFFWAKTLVLIPAEILFGLLVSAMGYFMFGYQSVFHKYLLCWFTIVLSFWTAESLGQLFAMMTPTTELAILAFGLVIIPLISLTGFLASSIPVYYKWLQHLSFLRYANSAIFQNEMSGLTLKGADGMEMAGEDLAAQNGLNSSLSIAENIWIVVGILIFVRICAFVALHLSYRLNWL